MTQLKFKESEKSEKAVERVNCGKGPSRLCGATGSPALTSCCRSMGCGRRQCRVSPGASPLLSGRLRAPSSGSSYLARSQQAPAWAATLRTSTRVPGSGGCGVRRQGRPSRRPGVSAQRGWRAPSSPHRPARVIFSSAATPSNLQELAPLSDSFCRICAPGG